MKGDLNIDSKKVLWTGVTLILGWLSYISVSTIDNRATISRLEEKTNADGRQDEELREVRRALQQITLLHFKDEGASKDPLSYGDPSNAASMSAVQMDLEAMLGRKGK